MDLIIISFRTIFFYFLVVIAYRIMGKREVGQLGIIDLIVSFIISELVTISIENYQNTMLYSIIPIITLIILEISLANISIKSNKIRKILSGKETPIIINGKLNYKEMKKQRYSIDDLLLELRQKDIKSIKDVEYAFLETNGKLSIFKYNILKIKSTYPMPLIIDGEINKNTLKRINKSIKWLYHKLDINKLSLSDIFYAFYKNNKIYIIKKEI